MILIKGQDYLQDWFQDGHSQGIWIIPTPNRFIDDKVAIAWLKYYIEHFNLGPDADWKLILMDNHGSHYIAKFVALINKYNICPCPLIAHLIHCM